MVSRMLRAARGDSHLYEEVEHDIDATGQAMLVVVLVALASGVGILAEEGLLFLLLGVVWLLVTWLLWAVITYWVGKTLFRTRQTRVTLGQMMRTLAFALTPGVLLVFAFVPVLGFLLVPVVLLWILWLGVIAVRQAMDFSTIRALATALVGAVPFLVVRLVLMAVVI
jgi:hypothetical protein